MDKRTELLQKGISHEDVDNAGYEDLTYGEWLEKKYNGSNSSVSSQAEAYEENRRKRLLSLKMAKDIQAYHNQGQVVDKSGFKLAKTPSILKVETENLNQTIYMFSPEWQEMMGTAEIVDEKLFQILDAQEKKAVIKARVEKAAEQKRKEEEERNRKREQEILDYSAKVEGGFIEVKIGEDVTAMREAFQLHHQKRREAFMRGLSTKQIDEMGLVYYTWDEWVKYYRKMHGLPEDGIKRIPFEGKRKERRIDWTAR